jgi:ribosome biogenesis GTPase
MIRLEQIGWSDFFRRAVEDGVPGRVFRASRGHFAVWTEAGEIDAEPSGRLYSIDEVPVTGDWVVLRAGTNLIEAILPRRTRFARKQPGARVEEQVLAANIDVLFLVAGLDGDFNLRRLERYLLLAGESGARAAIVLNKADLCGDPGAAVEQARAVGSGVPVILTSALEGTGLAGIEAELRAGETAALLGSSGAGKSTIVNRLLGVEAQRTAVVAEDGRGRHTTTGRELILMPGGWLLMDLPGLREVQLWAGAGSLDRTFPEIAELAQECRFRDCRHEGEPGCAVAWALETEQLDAARLKSFDKLRRELAYLERQQDQTAALAEKRRWKQIHKAARLRQKW